jgi:hypothetical protein
MMYFIAGIFSHYATWLIAGISAAEYIYSFRQRTERRFLQLSRRHAATPITPHTLSSALRRYDYAEPGHRQPPLAGRLAAAFMKPEGQILSDIIRCRTLYLRH